MTMLKNHYVDLTFLFVLFLLEISNFLTDSECEHIQNLAKKNGLRESVAGFEEQAYKGEIEEALKQSGKENDIKILNASRVPNFPSQPWEISRYKKTLIFNLNVEHNLMTYLMPTGLDMEFIQARHSLLQYTSARPNIFARKEMKNWRELLFTSTQMSFFKQLKTVQGGDPT